MRTTRLMLTIAALAATACQPNVAQTPQGVKSAAPRPAASVTTAASSPLPTASPSPAFAKLQRPTGEVSVLSGSIVIDAAYAVAAGSNLISNNGAKVLAAGGGTLAADGGGALISDKGAGVVASGAGNVIAGNTGNVIAGNTGNLISDKGAGVTTKFLLAADALATGTVLPAAGMRVQVRNLVDGQPVSLGVGPDGTPVYAIYSNADGRYEVYVPKSLARNVLVVAEVPQATDARLAYNLVVSPQTTASQAIDEDTSLVSKFMRESFRGKVQELLAAPNFDDPAFLLETFPTIAKFPAYGELIKTAATHMRAKVSQNKIPAAKLDAVAAAAADAMIAFVDLSNVKLITDGTKWTGSVDEAALPAMAVVLKHVREAVIKKGLPFVASQPYLADAKTPVELKKPTDVATFMVGTYLSSTKPGLFNKIRDVFANLEVPAEDVDHLFAADNGVVIQLGVIFATDEAARAAVDAAIDQVAKEP
ncbi:MAG: hypothetical protein JWM80_5155 [Cyanobacteria bacterium RYN_339]|nr:hypothetical protein [Cyanobacteria bacterium RYN_339]